MFFRVYFILIIMLLSCPYCVQSLVMTYKDVVKAASTHSALIAKKLASQMLQLLTQVGPPCRIPAFLGMFLISLQHCIAFASVKAGHTCIAY
jgi:hypothetical protein